MRTSHVAVNVFYSLPRSLVRTLQIDMQKQTFGILTGNGIRCEGSEGGNQQGCQMAKFDPFLSLDCARVEGVGAQSKERKGSNFAA